MSCRYASAEAIAKLTYIASLSNAKASRETATSTARETIHKRIKFDACFRGHGDYQQ